MVGLPGARAFAGDPLAALKAGAVTALLYAAFYSVPDKYKQIVIEAVETADAMTIAFAAGIALAFILLLASSGSIWRALTFTAFPRDRARTTACVLWLHGLGDRGAGFLWLRDQLRQAGHSHVMFALPDADLRPVTAAEGGKKRAWFNLTKLPVSLEEPDDLSGLKSAVEKVQDWIAELDKQGIPADRIILGGFSQGAAVAAWAAATSSHKLAGCVLWSGYAPRHEALVSALKSGPNASGCPFIVTHGDKDQKVLPIAGERLADTIKKAGAELKSRTVYEGLGHGCHPQMLSELVAFVGERLAPKTAAAAAAAKKKGRKAD